MVNLTGHDLNLLNVYVNKYSLNTMKRACSARVNIIQGSDKHVKSNFIFRKVHTKPIKPSIHWNMLNTCFIHSKNKNVKIDEGLRYSLSVTANRYMRLSSKWNIAMIPFYWKTKLKVAAEKCGECSLGFIRPPCHSAEVNKCVCSFNCV